MKQQLHAASPTAVSEAGPIAPRWLGWLLVGGLGMIVAACGANPVSPPEPVAMKIQLTSPAFTEGQPIPTQYTCDGKDISPPLQWTNVPTGTQSLALIVEDPDAPVGTWTHWVLYGLGPTRTNLPEGVDQSQYVLNGARQGLNDFRRLGYGGPCPPPGKPHRYFFKLYALDSALELKPGLSRKELLAAMAGHVLAEGQLMGTYGRK